MSTVKRESTSQLAGSERARQHAALILEVFAGVRATHQASEAMGVSVNRYYQLEARGLQGMLTALEPRPRGRQRGPEDEIEKLKQENERLTRDVTRLQSLVRVAQRSLGIEMSAKKKEPAPGRRRRATHRGKKVVALLRKRQDHGSPGEAKVS